MAELNAYIELDFLDIDLNWYVREFRDLEFYDDQNTPVNGVIYEDALFVNGFDDPVDLGFALLGTDISFDGLGNIVSGQINGLGEFVWEGNDLWLAEGLSVSAVDLYNVILTADNADDLALVEAALSGADVIDLSDQTDRVSGFDGDDLIFGRFGNDILYGGSGNDEIHGEGDSDVIFGQAGNDWLEGGSGNDTLNGGSGNDLLDGGRGLDEATGGSGVDSFVFYVGDGKMIVTDFEPGVDLLVLGNAGAGFSIEDLLPFVSQQGRDVVIGAGDQEIRFKDTLLSDLDGGDVVLV